MIKELPQALLLVGGLGTRLKSVVSDRPKPMALIHDKPFLEWLVLYLKKQGVRRVVFASGYLAEMIENHFGNGSRWGMEISYSVEEEPLGTGGALRLVKPKLIDDTFYMINGDTLFAADLAAMQKQHVEKSADLTLAMHHVEDNSRYGKVLLEGDRILAFEEKPVNPVPSWINAGTFLMNTAILENLPDKKKFSFEIEVIPNLLNKGACFGIKQKAYFVDIGLPETYYSFADDIPGLLNEGVFG